MEACKKNENSNRSANYGTTNKSASAGFFVSPKTKNAAQDIPVRQKILEYVLLRLTFIPQMIQ